VIRRACKDRDEPNLYAPHPFSINSNHKANHRYSVRKFINDENWYLNLNRARHLEPHARFVKPQCIHSRQTDISHGTDSDDSEDPQLALYVSLIMTTTMVVTN
jgi:hypothetical protein